MDTPTNTAVDVPVAPDSIEQPQAPATQVAEVQPKKPTTILLHRYHDVSAFASDDSTRYVINSIHVNLEKHRVEATNGRMAILVPLNGTGEDFPPTSAPMEPAVDCILPAKETSRAISRLPKNMTLDVLNCGLLGTVKGKPVLVGNDLDTELATTLKPIEGKYPNIDQVMPEGEPKTRICLSKEYLGKILDWANKHGNQQLLGIKLEIWDELSPARITIDLPDNKPATVVLMPVRMA